MGRARLKIAVIGCEPKDCIKLEYNFRKHEIRHLLRKKIEKLGDRYDVKVHWPVENKKDFPSTRNIDAAVIPGSPLNVDEETLSKTEWMKKLLDFIAHTHEKVPMLGICFGHQAIAKTFGSGIRSYGREIFYEIGFEPTRLTKEGSKSRVFGGVSENFMALYSHFTYVSGVPSGGVLLAESVNRNNKSIQAYQIGETTYGVQFHPDYGEHNIAEIVKARNEIIMRNIPDRRIIYTMDGREDHKIIQNFLQLI